MNASRHHIPFYKMHGSGNDFVLIDNRALRLPPSFMEHWAKAVCKRSFGVGADGLIFLDNPGPDHGEVDYIWHFFNADGSRPEMCGNGSRCAASLAYRIGLAPKTHLLGTDVGPIQARVFPEQGEVKVQLTPYHDLIKDIQLDVAGLNSPVHFVNTGVPHVVVLCDDVNAQDPAVLGREIRYHERFAPKGTNVNFIQIVNDAKILLRTYERGVESETFACGTGAAASVIVSSHLKLTGNQVSVTTSGGEQLTIELQGEAVFLTGKAVLVYQGELDPFALGLSEFISANM